MDQIGNDHLNAEGLELLKLSDPERFNKLREKNPEWIPHLSGADLRGVILVGANLSGADLSDATLNASNLYGANLTGANLHNTKLHKIKIDFRTRGLPVIAEF